MKGDVTSPDKKKDLENRVLTTKKDLCGTLVENTSVAVVESGTSYILKLSLPFSLIPRPPSLDSFAPHIPGGQQTR